MLNDLCWQPLAERREIARLILMFKIINRLAAVALYHKMLFFQTTFYTSAIYNVVIHGKTLLNLLNPQHV